MVATFLCSIATVLDWTDVNHFHHCTMFFLDSTGLETKGLVDCLIHHGTNSPRS